jgi:hypothetical protein
MKKIILLFMAVVVFSNITYAQSKKVLFEEFTNASCGPCASSNPALKAYLESKGDTIVAVKYHTNFPGFDPMYNQNPTDVESRRGGYYSDVNAVPWLKGDGNCFPDIWPFSQANFDAAFNTRKAITPLVQISITNSIIAGDSVRAVVNVNILTALAVGNYKVRIMAAEKVITFVTPPGTNGEMVFEHVFRKGAPDMTGLTLPTTSGNHQFIVKYKKESYWDMSKIVTLAFVQNDAATNKEVLNCNVSSPMVGIEPQSSVVPDKYSLNQNYPNPFNPETSISFSLPKNSAAKLTIYNSLGMQIAELVNENLIAGEYNYRFNASALSSGVYFYTLETPDFTSTKKMTLVK